MAVAEKDGNMKNLSRLGNPGITLFAIAGIAALLGTPYYVSAQKGRPVPGRIQTLTPYFLLKGEVSAVDGSLATVKTADYGPGMSHGSGIHSQAIALGKSYLIDLSRARFQATDGTPVANQPLAVGDKVDMLVNSKPGSPVQVGSISMFRYAALEVIRNDQTP
jgi:hypothetical protein